MNRLATCALAFVALFSPLFAVASTSALVVQQAWVRKAPGADTAAAYMVLKNTSTQAATIVGVRSPVAEHVMIHETSMVNGQSRMRMREKLVVAPGQSVTLAPNGLHVMLSGFKREVSVGDTVPLILQLENGEQVQAAAIVRPLDSQ